MLAVRTNLLSGRLRLEQKTPKCCLVETGCFRGSRASEATWGGVPGKNIRSARVCAAVLCAWLGAGAHTHVGRLRAIADWCPWQGHYGITQYMKLLMPFLWTFRERSGLHLLQKSFISVDDLRERLRAFEPGRAFTDRLGCVRERFLLGHRVCFLSVQVDCCFVLVRFLLSGSKE